MPRVVPSQVVQVIEKYFPQTKTATNISFTLDRGHRNECVSLAKLLDQIPAELLNPPTVDDYVKLISNIAILNFTLESWKTISRSHIDALCGKEEEGNPISIIHDMLLKCPDEAISSKTAGLEFIDDLNFRDSLRLDLSSANSALSNGEWKAATVLAGAITEALLLWAINKVTPVRQSDIEKAMKECKIKENDSNKWVLAQYNSVAKELNIIQERTYTQVDLAREFRDLIHPGREVREKVKCSIATAHSGIAAVELVIEDLSEQFRIP
jgi:hypothetical protein